MNPVQEAWGLDKNSFLEAQHGRIPPRRKRPLKGQLGKTAEQGRKGGRFHVLKACSAKEFKKSTACGRLNVNTQ